MVRSEGTVGFFSNVSRHPGHSARQIFGQSESSTVETILFVGVWSILNHVAEKRDQSLALGILLLQARN